MSKTALIFPGQASQYVGMAKDLYESSTEVRELYELASDEIGEDIARLSFEGPPETLKQTRFTQPAILLHSLAVLTMLKENLPSFEYACGHSLGEYAALAVTNAMSFEGAIKAVTRRATLMEVACNQKPGTMAAIMGLDEQQILQVCDMSSGTGVVVPANFNSKTQIVISGDVKAVKRAADIAKNTGAKRTLLLEVGGAFHSPLMKSAEGGLQEYLEGVELHDATKPVIANVTAEPTEQSSRIKELLVAQITAPVKWAQTMEYLSKNDVTTVIEIGPGKVLSGLAKRDMKPEKIISIDTLADVESFAAVTA